MFTVLYSIVVYIQHRTLCCNTDIALQMLVYTVSSADFEIYSLDKGTENVLYRLSRTLQL